MIVFPAQFEAFRTRGDGCRILSLSTYGESAEEVSKVINGKIGQEYLIMMIRTDSIELEQFRDETPEDTKERFRKHMNALIGQVAELSGKTAQDFRSEFKELLKRKGIIKETTKELDVNGYASVIVLLKNIKYDTERR